MNKNILFFLLSFLFLIPVDSLGQQNASVGEWTPYVSHYFPKQIAYRHPELYVITSGGFYTFNLSNDEMETFTTTDGLSGSNPSTIFYDEESSTVFIGFSNGIINYFQDPHDIQYLTDISRSQQFTNKTINQFYSHNGSLYIATGFGLVVYDPIKQESIHTIAKFGNEDSSMPVESVTISNDSIWVSMGNLFIYSCALSSPNISQPDSWVKQNPIPAVASQKAEGVFVFKDELYAIVDSTVWVKKNSVWESTPFSKGNFTSSTISGDVLMLTQGQYLEILFADGTFEKKNTFMTPISSYFTPRGIMVGDAVNGLAELLVTGAKYHVPEGPKKNFVYQLTTGDGELYVAPSSRDGTLASSDPSGIYYYDFDTGWRILSRSTGVLNEDVWVGFNVAYFHWESQTAYIGSNAQGIVAFQHGDTVATYSGYNSGLVGYDPQDIRISGIDIDQDGNLWATTILTAADYCLNVKTPEGEWYNYQFPGFQPRTFVIDNYGTKWMLNKKGGVRAFNERGTFDDLSDDISLFYTSGTGQGGLQSNTVYSIAKDKDGQIWIGTDDGVSVIYDPGYALNGIIQDASCPVFDRQCLMKSQRVNSITVDGGNRKWIGTDNGAFLISEDGQDLIHHFTTDNSELFSNRINDIAIEPRSGEVFIGTDMGIISYMGTAILELAPSVETYAFPNPVYSDFEGVVTIRGMANESSVKIATPDGLVVRTLESTGGQAIWDLNDSWGNRASTGVYVVLISHKSGEYKWVTKIALTER